MVPELLIAIDPGVSAGIAVFRAGVLLDAVLQGAPWDPIAAGPRAKVVLEEMKIRHSAKRGSGEALFVPERIGARLTALVPLENIRRIPARTWKGTVDADIMLDRIEAKLSLEERSRIPLLPKSTRHNVIDAIGIGLWALGRLRP